jgi:hypothetical protein
MTTHVLHKSKENKMTDKRTAIRNMPNHEKTKQYKNNSRSTKKTNIPH